MLILLESLNKNKNLDVLNDNSVLLETELLN